jgi:hypothetical protein
MIKKIFSLLFVAVFIFAFVVTALPLSAKNIAPLGIGIPDKAGVYDVPGNSKLKLRVFVHEDKGFDAGKANGKPAPAPAPTETCVAGAVGDPDSSAVVPGAGWKLPAVWQYRLNLASVPSSVGGANLPVIASSAFSAWQSAVAPGFVVITRGANTNTTRAVFDGQNIITWGRTSGSALAVSYIWYDQTTGVATEIDTIMNNKFKWEWSDPSTWSAGQICAYGGYYDAQEILTHELGHTMGLDDVYTIDYAHNTMYGYGSPSETKKDTLTIGDVIGVAGLYY